MAKKTTKEEPLEIPPVKKPGEAEPLINPEEPFISPEEDPDVIPQEDPFENPPYEVPPPRGGSVTGGKTNNKTRFSIKKIARWKQK